MKDVELYERLLGLSAPWSVKEVGLDLKRQTVTVRVVCDPGQIWACPKCRQRATIHEWTERKWRHLDTCQLRTEVHASVPRVRCDNEGCPDRGTQTVQVPWAEGSSRFSSLFECMAIRLMQECSLSGVAEILRISWDEAEGIMDRAVRRGLERKARQPMKLRQVCVDEKCAGRGQEYVTVVAAILADGRTEESLGGFWKTPSPEQLGALEAVGMDKWRPYWQSTMKCVPDAKAIITFDRFHIMQKAGEALNEVRRAEQAAGAVQLKGSRMDWLSSQESLTPAAQEHVRDLCSKCRKTGRAYAMKEGLRRLWSCKDASEGRSFLRWWTGCARRCRIVRMQ